MSVKGTQNYVIYSDRSLGSGSTGTVYFARHKVTCRILITRKCVKLENNY